MTLPHETSDVVRHVIEFLPTLRMATEEISGLLMEGNTTRAMRGLAELVTGLQELHKGLELLSFAYGSGSPGLNNCRIRLEALYPLMLTAVEDEDPVALSDLLSYELVPTLEACAVSLRSSDDNDYNSPDN
ncbi:MAG: hypothetical protein QMC81_01530 [Thermoanaerobacterales bacterium]|nr:hypothetical protein [Thermoanaerobacterales bacterium]